MSTQKQTSRKGDSRKVEKPAPTPVPVVAEREVVEEAQTTPDAAVVAARPKPPKRHFNRRGCRTSEYLPPGSTSVGLSKENQPSQIVIEVRFGLSKSARDVLSTRFPGVAFVCIGAQNHDHPVANLSRKVVWEYTVLARLERNEKVLDVYGDPLFNEGYNSRAGTHGASIDTMCHVHTPKDAVRRRRWGPQEVDGKVRWIDSVHENIWRFEQNITKYQVYDTFMFNHAIYYLPLSDLNRLVNLRPDTPSKPGPRVLAALHRFGVKRQDGTMDFTARRGTSNNGEQEWERTDDGTITQRNVLTGETYTHPDVEKFFMNYQYADEHGGMAWTTTLGCDEHYVIEFTACPSNIVPAQFYPGGVIRLPFDGRLETVATASKAELAPVLPPRYEEAVRTLRPSVVLGTNMIPGVNMPDIRIKVTKPDLLNTLEIWMVGRARTAAVLKDLIAKAQREAGQSALIGGTGKKIPITARELHEHVMLAFLGRIDEERGLISSIDATQALALNQALAGKGVSLGNGRGAFKQALKVALGVTAAMRAKHSSDAVITLLDEWL